MRFIELTVCYLLTHSCSCSVGNWNWKESASRNSQHTHTQTHIQKWCVDVMIFHSSFRTPSSTWILPEPSSQYINCFVDRDFNVTARHTRLQHSLSLSLHNFHSAMDLFEMLENQKRSGRKFFFLMHRLTNIFTFKSACGCGHGFFFMDFDKSFSNATQLVVVGSRWIRKESIGMLSLWCVN